MTWEDRIRNWHPEDGDISDFDNYDFNVTSADTDEDEEVDMPELLVYRAFIAKAPAYEWLLASLRREFLLGPAEPNLMEDIKQKILHFLPSSHNVSRKKSADAYKMTFELEFDPITFIKEQAYSEEPDKAVERAITLTGYANDVQALTCGQYLYQTWPTTGEHIIKLVKTAVRSGTGHRHTCKSFCLKSSGLGSESGSLGDLPDSTRLTAWINGSQFMVETFGTGDAVAEIGEQLAWLGAALRSSPYELGVSYCTPFISDIRVDNTPPQGSSISLTPEILCSIEFVVEKEVKHLEPPNGQCWHNMFRNPVVVKGFPIPRKSEPDTGLEIPLNMMAGLARTQRANIFDGKVFIKGFSTLLVPTKHSEDLLIWHVLYNKDGNRISYRDNTMPHAKNVNISHLETVRHVVGWCSEIKNYAGRKISNKFVVLANLLIYRRC
jgi:hypothetical protein